MTVSLETLDRLFEDRNQENSIECRGRCHVCHCRVKVKIARTSGGFGFSGGILYEINPSILSVVCPKCHLSNEAVKRSEKEKRHPHPHLGSFVGLASV